ncbi:hypothetical protein QVZ41_13550 [Wenyingzhuangia sp. chi5]|uniref:Uncharacterized protein n=1 Tax=Wenyingzhuangia gilva TaxID=3057677 RepID=A0ABT8VV59_9FLAO|nr:DUF6695 family protein [Wenyingzhuangia sp. chi5]MDO3695870.1 hypothetical protein [Wenyingzhuangia sp. chi5]
MKYDGVIVVLSYPDTVVRPAHSEFSSKVWPKLGIGSENAIQAGHAAMLLIDKKTNNVNYFDFGRYITSYGNGRVRSKETDPELAVPFTAKFKDDVLVNLNEMLLWLDANPEKTHGDGRLVASVNAEIDYTKAIDFVNYLIAQKEIPYGAFVKSGSNCARFITDTILNSSGNTAIVLKLKTSNLLTPSPIGNVIKGTTEDDIYVVENQEIQHYTNRSVIKEYGACFLKKFDRELNLIGTELPNKALFNLENATWLGGIGSGAWFKIEAKEDVNLYRISRHTVKGEKDFEGVFKIKDFSFDIEESYEFVHPTNCMEVYIEQNSKEFILSKVSS